MLDENRLFPTDLAVRSLAHDLYDGVGKLPIVSLPMGGIVETNASLGIAPRVAGRLPEALEAIPADHVGRQTALLDAVSDAVGGDLFDLFRTDPLLASLTEDAARRAFTLDQATARHLPRGLQREAA